MLCVLAPKGYAMIPGGGALSRWRNGKDEFPGMCTLCLSNLMSRDRTWADPSAHPCEDSFETERRPWPFANGCRRACNERLLSAQLTREQRLREVNAERRELLSPSSVSSFQTSYKGL